MNVISLIGRVGRDLEVRTTSTGKSVVGFSIAVDNPFDKDNPDWFNVNCWGNQVDFVSSNVRKGARVGVNGRCHVRKYTDQSGNQKLSVDVNADRVTVIDWPADNGDTRQSATADTGQNSDDWDPFADE